MKRLVLTNFSLKYPWLVVGMVALITLIAASQFPKVHFDNDPQNMLSSDEFVRVFNNETKQKFGLYDFVIVGVVNEENPDGIFNVKTLERIDTLTYQLLSLRKGEGDLPEVTMGRPGSETKTMDLNPESLYKRILNVAFRHNPNRLFTESGDSSIISRELISPSVVDNIKQAGMGSLKLEFLMEHVPTNREEALIIRDDAMNNPLFNGTLVSEDSKAVCIYIPISDKTFSYNIANLVRNLTSDWDGDDHVYIAGLPVAEDTFGVEMLVQMSTSAPLAMLILFLIMFVFFRRITLIIPPLLMAGVTVVWTMGLLIGLGFDVHIMSSMIPIFIMPITVCDSIHVLSEFFDSYGKHNDKSKTLRHVMRELFMPMLFTSTTTMAGFASLATTPIPPVKVFGLHVAFGVGVGWLLTMTFVPAFIKLFISEKSLASLKPVDGQGKAKIDPLGRMLNAIAGMTYRKSTAILVITVLVLGLSIYGITVIQVNDNPVKWFTKNHDIRVADTILNSHFGGTYTAYLTITGHPNEMNTCREESSVIRKQAQKRFGAAMPEATREFMSAMDKIEAKFNEAGTSDPNRCFVELAQLASDLDKKYSSSWITLADEINYLDETGLTMATLSTELKKIEGVRAADRDLLLQRLDPHKDLTGIALLEQALKVSDEFTALSFYDFVFDAKAEVTAPVFKQPEVLRYISGLQRHLKSMEKVGKTTSAADAVKKASYELNFVTPAENLTAHERGKISEKNNSFFSIPDTASAVGQVYIQLEGMKKKDSIFHMVSRDFQEANIWVQLTSGDNQDMSVVVAEVDNYIAGNPPPVDLDFQWAGLTYLNVIWQKKMVVGMIGSLASSFVVVLIMMLLLFRSGWFGVLSMIPLTITICFIYGLIGWVGKDYDMPVAILSAMTLGLSVDFAIHFLERSREAFKRTGSWKEANREMFSEPARAISRNAIVIALGFTPLLLAPLVPYRTVGFFLAMIMLLSWMATLLILPALLRTLEKHIFAKPVENEME